MPSTYKAGVGSLVLAIDRQDIISANSRARDDQKKLKVWLSTLDGFETTSVITGINSTTKIITTNQAHKLQINDTIKSRTTINGLTKDEVYYVLTVPTTTTFTIGKKPVPNIPVFTTNTGLNATEYARQVNELYLKYLGRYAEQGGLDYWVGTLVSGASINSVETTISTSTEAVTRLADTSWQVPIVTGTNLNITIDNNLIWDTEGLLANITNLKPDIRHYFKYALISTLDTTIFSISSQYSFIPKSNTTAVTQDLPPIPYGISVVAGALSTILITVPTTTKSFTGSITSGSKVVTITSGNSTGIVTGTPIKVAETLTGTPTLGTPVLVNTVNSSTQLTMSQNATGTGTAKFLYSTGTDYNTSSYTTEQLELYNSSSTAHKSVVVYGVYGSSVPSFESAAAKTFADVEDKILGEFKDQAVFSIPAEPGSYYALFFKYRNKADRLSPVADGPYTILAGTDMQKLVEMLAESITEGTLFNKLQTRLSRIDRSDQRPQLEISELNNQYTVKIDDAGYVSGFGLASTRADDNTVSSEFGVVADRFWISQPAHVGSTAPTDAYLGRVWVDTSSANSLNEGLVGGVKVYYNTYMPSVHNAITYNDDSTYQYWEIKTLSQLNNLIGDGTNGYTNRDKWNPATAYVLKDYILDEESGNYYVCRKAYTPAVITNLATKNADKVGNFTATGTFAVNNTIYITGTEVALSTANGGGNQSTTKLGSSYKSSGTFYYITEVSGSVFTLSLKKSGNPITTAIRGQTKHYNGTAWTTSRTADMLPFVVQSTPVTKTDPISGSNFTIPAGVYINSAFIQDASITNAKIANASIDSAKISSLTADKIKGGTIEADLINTGALTVDKIDIQSMRGTVASSWTIASPTGGTSEISRQIDLPPGNYEIILYANFSRDDAYNEFGTYTSTIQAEVAGVAGSTVTAEGKWEKLKSDTEFEIKVNEKNATITDTKSFSVSTSVSTSVTSTATHDLTAPTGTGGGIEGGE
jgi:hypothetical protein